MVRTPRYLVGIDEVGRGPLAGPVAVGAVIVPYDFFSVPNIFFGVKDSKKLSPLQRRAWFNLLHISRKAGIIDYAVSFVGPRRIEERGINGAIRAALRRSLFRVVRSRAAVPQEIHVLLDGGLLAPENFSQTTIIKGDETEPVISLASVAAKELRDRRMIMLAKLFPAYGFECHKGYATRAHYSALDRSGPCDLHRAYFLRKFFERKTRHHF